MCRGRNGVCEGEFDPDLVLELDESEHFRIPCGGRPPSWDSSAFISGSLRGTGTGPLREPSRDRSLLQGGLGVGSALSTVDLGSEILLKFGSLEQKERFLTPLTKGEARLGVAFAESEDGRDLTVLSAMAEKRTDEYSLRGKKRFVLNAPLANAFLTLCQEPKEGWITIDCRATRDGIEIHPIEKMGLRMIPFGDLFFKEACVPLSSRVGKKDRGSRTSIITIT